MQSGDTSAVRTTQVSFLYMDSCSRAAAADVVELTENVVQLCGNYHSPESWVCDKGGGRAKLSKLFALIKSDADVVSGVERVCRCLFEDVRSSKKELSAADALTRHLSPSTRPCRPCHKSIGRRRDSNNTSLELAFALCHLPTYCHHSRDVPFHLRLPHRTHRRRPQCQPLRPRAPLTCCRQLTAIRAVPAAWQVWPPQPPQNQAVGQSVRPRSARREGCRRRGGEGARSMHNRPAQPRRAEGGGQGKLWLG